MKNKLFLSFAACLFAGLMIFNLNLVQQKTAGDITLAGVEMVAGADGEQGGGGDCEMTQECAGGICSILNAKKRVLANGCKKQCDYTCTVQQWPWPF